MGDGERVAERADMDEMAQQFAEGQDALLSTLQGGQRFLPWELEMIRVGLATGQVQTVFQKLTAHYDHQYQCWLGIKKRLVSAAIIVTITLLLLAVAAVGLERISVVFAAMSVAVVVAILGVLSAGFFYLWRAWQLARLSQWIDRCVMRLPVLGEILRLRQTWLFLSHLELALAAGLGFPQSLRLAERRLLSSPFKEGFARLARLVADGKSFSRALLEQGYLQNVSLAALPKGADSLGALSLLSTGVVTRYRLLLDVFAECLPLALGICLPLYGLFLLLPS
jgi:type II secretory pathway component PulF